MTVFTRTRETDGGSGDLHFPFYDGGGESSMKKVYARESAAEQLAGGQTAVRVEFIVRLGGRQVGEPLAVGRSVLMVEHQVHVGPGHFPCQHLLDVGIHVEHVELRAVRFRESGGHLLAQGDALVFPGREAVGEGTFARVGDQAVERVVFLVRGRGFLQIGPDLGIACLTRLGGADAARVDVAVDTLRGIAGQPVVEQVVPGAVLCNETEFQAEVVVEAVGWHACVEHRKGLLVHLESRGEMLGSLDHGDGDVADENGAFQPLFAVQLPDAVAHLFRCAPGVGVDFSRQALRSDGAAVGFQFAAAGLRRGVVHEDGEAPVSNLLCPETGAQQTGKNQ